VLIPSGLGIRQGRTDAREPTAVKPVAEEHVYATLPHVSPQVAAMIQLQLLTGMRPGEVLIMRGCDLDTSGELWTYTPASHKTEHHGRERIIHLGPRSQEILQPFLKHDLNAYLFSPHEAEQTRRANVHTKRRTPISYGNRPGTNRRTNPKRKPQLCYTVASYRRAIERGCHKAFSPPEHLRPKLLENGKRESQTQFLARLTPAEKDQLQAWHHEHHWHPNQLRHTAATRLRKQFGIEAARVVLGHSSAVVTEIYAEVDREKASQIMGRVG
jgi:integrase